jgi:uncharacterized protein
MITRQQPMSLGCHARAPMSNVTIFVVVGAVAAGLVQGLSGFAFGLIAMAFWVWWVEPQLAGPMVVFGSLLGQLLSLGVVRLAIGRAAPFIVGGLIGVPLGVLALAYIDATIFKACIGMLLATYCPVMLLARNLPYVTAGGRLADGGIGLIGGIMGGLGGLTGPAPTLWCVLRGWDKDTQRAVFQSFNIAMHTATLTAYAIGGLITYETLRMFALVAPAMLIPTLVGTRLYARVSDATFRTVVLVLLGLSGVALLAASVPALLHR